MKRIERMLLLCLSIALTFCVSGVTFSASATDLSASSSSGSTGISANVTAASKPEFTVTIPSSGIAFESLVRTANDSFKQSDFSVSVDGVEYLNGKTIYVTVSAPGDRFVLTCDGYELPYEVYKDGTQTALRSGEQFASFTEDGEASGYVEVNEKDIRTTGTYSGSMIFTVSVEDEA